jgi:hypothetical protein
MTHFSKSIEVKQILLAFNLSLTPDLCLFVFIGTISVVQGFSELVKVFMIGFLIVWENVASFALIFFFARKVAHTRAICNIHSKANVIPSST